MKPRSVINGIICGIIATWMIWAGISSAVYASKHKGGGWITVGDGERAPEQEIRVSQEEYRRYKVTSGLMIAGIGLIPAWMAYHFFTYDIRRQRLKDRIASILNGREYDDLGPAEKHQYNLACLALYALDRR